MENQKQQFTVESYILRPNLPFCKSATTKADRDYYYASIDDTNAIRGFASDIDQDRMEGGIRLLYGDTMIMDLDLHDDVHYLWTSFLYMIEDFLKNKVANTDLPYCCAYVFVAVINDDSLLFLINHPEGGEWRLPTKEFMSALLNHAGYFFQRMALFFPQSSSYEEEFGIIDRITAILSDYSSNGWWPFVIREYLEMPKMYPNLLSEASKYKAPENFCYLDNVSHIGSIYASEAYKARIGFLYFEYYNQPLFDLPVPYSLDEFCNAATKGLAAVIHEGERGIVDIDAIKIVIEKEGEAMLHVTITQHNQTKRMEVLYKPFLLRMVDAVSNILIIVNSAYKRHTGETIYQEKLELVWDMRAVLLTTEKK